MQVTNRSKTTGGADHRHHSQKMAVDKCKGISGDERNIVILLFLYLLQGIPLGLAAAVPLILTSKHVSYKEQAEFSFAYWPFSLKLLWAPIVDSCFVARFGRRKTWIVPTQYLIGITMFVLAANVQHYLGELADENGVKAAPNVFALTCMFFVLNFLAATQDIAVDGWALTMLQRHNIGYASTCNSVGQTAGYFLGYVFYLALESYNVLTLADFLNIWGVVFMVNTTLIAMLKHEQTCDHENPQDLGIVDSYKLLFKIVQLKLMPVTVVMLLTSKIGFAAADNVTGLKLMEQGVPKQSLAMIAIPMMPLQITLPWVISKYITGPRPMNVFLKAMPFRLLMGLVFCWIVYVTPRFATGPGQFPWTYYALLLCVYAVHQVFLYCMFVSIMAFFAKVSDPLVGGTYMTLLNTLTNLGGNWPSTVALWSVDVLTYKGCYLPADSNHTLSIGCNSLQETERCEKAGGACHTDLDGYYAESIICVVIGFLWLAGFGWGVINRLQEADDQDWRVPKRQVKSRPID